MTTVACCPLRLRDGAIVEVLPLTPADKVETQRAFARFEGIRRRTLAVADCIPPEKIEWSYRAGKFTFGDILRHLGAIERYMFAENARGAPSCYPGHSAALADGPDEVRRFLDRMHGEAVVIFSALSPAAISRTTSCFHGHYRNNDARLKRRQNHDAH